MPRFGHIVRSRTSRLLRGLCAIVLSGSLTVPAVAADLVVVGDTQQPYFQSFVAEFSRTPAIADRYGKPLVMAQGAPDASREVGAAKVVVTVGNEAARRYHSVGEKGFMVHALMTEGFIDQHKASGESYATNHAVLLIEQPVGRYMTAIKTALPAHTRLGVLYGPRSERHAAEVQRMAKVTGLTLIETTIYSEGEIGEALSELLPRIDVLLTLPDHVVVNANTARILILDTYQRGVALVGYSQSMVKAGALMAIHSTPQQLGHQTADIVTRLVAGGSAVDTEEFYPDDFSVSINYQVARVLGVELPEEELLHQRIRAQGVRP